MIKKIETPDEFNNFNKTDIYSVRIMSLLSAYGTGYDFAVFYKQLNDDGKITAIISRLDSDITISYSDCNFDELIEFIEAIGCSSCLCDGLAGYNRTFDSGIIMSSDKKKYFSAPCVETDHYPKLMDLFSLDDYDSADFEMWYVDVCHRIRHGCAKAYSLNINGEIISSGIFSSIYNNNAILTSVRTAPGFRHLGFGSALVSEMVNDVKGTVYLMREAEKNEGFYKRLGFENTGIWRMYK